MAATIKARRNMDQRLMLKKLRAIKIRKARILAQFHIIASRGSLSGDLAGDDHFRCVSAKMLGQFGVQLRFQLLRGQDNRLFELQRAFIEL